MVILQGNYEYGDLSPKAKVQDENAVTQNAMAQSPLFSYFSLSFWQHQ